MMKKLKKKTKIILISVASALLVAAVVTGGFFAGVEIAYNQAFGELEIKAFDAGSSGDRIHFLNTGSSDAILLESDGKFALIDCGEDSDNPRGFPSLDAKGREDEILNYLKARAAVNGKVTLEFILGTHAHSDHIGGFDTIVSDPDVVVKKAFLKRYISEIVTDYEKKNWDNQEVYDQMRNALDARGVEVVEDIPGEPFSFGNLTVRFVNNGYDTEHTNIGENDNSVGAIVSKGNCKAFLAADMDNKTGDEARLAPEIGRVDLLKLGHHGYPASTTWALLNELRPRVAVACNDAGGVFPDVKLRLKIEKTAILETGAYDGIVAEFGAERFTLYRAIYGGIERSA